MKWIDTYQWGVSIVICCHNGVSRLPQTLAHLAAQQMDNTVDPPPWEVIVVDNGSTDRTALLALDQWPATASAPLRVVEEPQLGLIWARLRGFAAANYALVSFIDDDNWPSPHWVETVSSLMRKEPAIGACGGQLSAVSDGPLPAWLARYADSYAVGKQALHSGDVTTTRGYLWGAGLTIRKSAWDQLRLTGFSPLLSGRSGLLLAAGEDHELCLALRLAGWRLWYDERLQLQHYLPPTRLAPRYLRRLRRGFGAASVVLHIYQQHLDPPVGPLRRFRQKWLFEIAACLLLFLVHWGKAWLVSAILADAEALWLQSAYYRGKFQSLRKQRRTYAQNVQQLHALADTLQRCTMKPSKPQYLAVNSTIERENI